MLASTSRLLELTVTADDVTAYYDGQSHGITVNVTGAEKYTVKLMQLLVMLASTSRLLMNSAAFAAAVSPMTLPMM